MKGEFEYINKDYALVKTDDSEDIPSDAWELILFRTNPPKPPHSEADHALIEETKAEFIRVFKMIYGHEPGER